MIPFQSKRNQVYPSIYYGQPAVEKYFSNLDDWKCEQERYALLSGKVPVVRILHSEPGKLVMEYSPYLNLLDVMEQQEQIGFESEVWERFADWLRQCYASCGVLPTDKNLRNFLWDTENRQIIGLDLEGFMPCSLEQCAAWMIAALKTYDPPNTTVKQKAAELLVERLRIYPPKVSEECELLAQQRQKIRPQQMSGIVLAGGMSRRMGKNKAELCLMGQTLLERQVKKLRALGIMDILISGSDDQNLPGVRKVCDVYPNRGPLGGLHAALQAAKHPCCVVLSVDVPLIPVSTLAHLQRSHTAGVTVLRCEGEEEPLIGIYDCSVSQVIESLIAADGAPVRALRKMVPWNCFDYLGPKKFLSNCNTPEEFADVEETVRDFSKMGLPVL